MDKFKEFQGRNLDECIKQATEWFDCPRDTLEIEIQQDAKSGIFGIVGARKAKIRARRVHVAEKVRTILGNTGPDSGLKLEGGKQDRRDAPVRDDPAVMQPLKKIRSQGNTPAEESFPRRDERIEAPAPQKAAPERRVSEKEPDLSPDDAFEDEAADTPLPELSAPDRDKLEHVLIEIVGTLVKPLAGREVEVNVDLAHGRPRVKIDWHGDAGLLIGRDGQTLVALQYLASRMLSRAMDMPLRVQLDIGEYRSRQDDKLRELAKTLAEKARRTGRPFSTRPLSSYHRRIIHLALQDAEDVQTRSAGEGTLKRVLISPRRR